MTLMIIFVIHFNISINSIILFFCFQFIFSTIGGIVGTLIAFVSFLAFIDGVLAYFGSMIDLPDLTFKVISFFSPVKTKIKKKLFNLKIILSKLFIPIAMMLGVDWNDAEYIARLIGIKTFINEFVAYQELSQYINNDIISVFFL